MIMVRRGAQENVASSPWLASLFSVPVLVHVPVHAVPVLYADVYRFAVNVYVSSANH